MSDNKINKSSLEEAKANFEEIQKYAIEEATKNLQEDVSKKVIELMNDSLENTLKEEVTINADGTTVTIDDEGNVDVSSDDEVNIDDSEEITVSDEDDEIEIDNSEIDEMNLEEMNFEEQEMAAPAPAPAPAPEAEVAPVEEIPMEEPIDEVPMEEPIEEVNPLIQPLMDKIEELMTMMGGNAEGGEEIDIIDDTEEMPAPEAAPAPAPEEAMPVAEEITFEVVNNEEDEDDILEIIGDNFEDEDEELEEMHGVGQVLRRSNTNSKLPGQGTNFRQGIRENKENKAQYEAKLAELIKENKSLKAEVTEKDDELIKFENGFIKLQENFGEMQDYNAKLVMAYKVAMAGGLTTNEKVQISEQFDKCDTVEDAEKLYKSIVSEHQIKVNKNPEKSIKSNSIKSKPVVKSVSQPLYESKETLRMKSLAGIKKLN
jgi:hypothetical protein